MPVKPGTVYQHPLAYLLALEGMALAHGFVGEYDREFTLERLAEVRALLDSAGDFGDGRTARPIDVTEGYARGRRPTTPPGTT